MAANLPVISFCSGVHWGRGKNHWQRCIGNSRHEPLHPRCNLLDEGARQQQLVRLLEHGIGRPCRKYTGTPVLWQPHDFEATSIDPRQLYNWVLEGNLAENVWVVVLRFSAARSPGPARGRAGQFARKVSPADQFYGHFATNNKYSQSAFKCPVQSEGLEAEAQTKVFGCVAPGL